METTIRSLFLFACGLSAFAQQKTALDRYVAAPDANYSWQYLKTVDAGAAKAHILSMTSQQYLTEKEVDRPIWKHWVTIVRPPEVVGTTGFLFITGGNNNSPNPPERPDLMLIETAVSTKSIVVELRMVPNQPIKFADAPQATSEDASIAYTWDKFIKTGDEKWPLRLPMTKAAVRAMDAASAFCATDQGGRATLEKFVVAGGSKRGWTTWTTAAVDKRVTAIVPLVIDVLNVEKSMSHHWQAYGFWAPAVGDYVNKDLMSWFGTPQNKALMAIEDPYSYRDRFTMPKFIVNSAGDQFFLPDSWQFYWKDLADEKHLRYVPNSDHSLRNTDAPMSMIAFYDMVLRGQARPKYGWNVGRDSIEVTVQDKPAEVKLWQASNEKARDFRQMTIQNAYTSTPVTPGADGKYTVKLKTPEKGFTAYFVELTYPSGGKYPLKVTTGVKVLPDTYSFPPPSMRGSGQ